MNRKSANKQSAAAVRDKTLFQREKARFQKKRQEKRERADKNLYTAPTSGLGDGEKRDIGYAIEKNKGLTRKRKKEYRNPRVRNKNRYTKAMKKHKKLTNTGSDLNRAVYQGEASGINPYVIKSVSLEPKNK
eukprot:TRINITY_DN10461_c0_g1_i1.p1 TRINITY_DN10461_c0_g1~~TRINITY_DN10461_c0_g1_i1.p1  ORF type:complete len:132 (-),score=27.90 TRINITY_DN10461_c0_g1_i1:36-431(-)